MTTPDPMASLFDAYTDDTTAEVAGSAPEPLWRKAKRRRAGRIAATGAAVLTLAVPAGLLLTVGIDGERSSQQVAATDDDAPAEEPIAVYTDRYANRTADLAGHTVDLPSFIPGNTEVDEACGVGDTVIVDGWQEEPEEGEVFILDAARAILPEDGARIGEDGVAVIEWVGFFGCDAGDETVFQVVVLQPTGNDTWVASEQLVHSQLGGESPLGIEVDDEHALMVGFAERWDPEAGQTDIECWVERVELDDQGEVVRERVEGEYWNRVAYLLEEIRPAY